MTNLFATNESTNPRALRGSVELSQTADSVMQTFWDTLVSNSEVYRGLIIASQESREGMQILLETFIDFTTIDADFLKELEEDDLNALLKSIQSKISRLRSLHMTQNNYQNLLMATISEMLLRNVCGKPIKARGRKTLMAIYTAEELEILAQDQEQVKRLIRSLASRKSNLKKQADFDENSDAWNLILTVEEQLKGIRKEPDGRNNWLKKLLADVVIEELKSAQAKALLQEIKDHLFPTTNEVSEEEVPTDEVYAQ